MIKLFRTLQYVVLQLGVNVDKKVYCAIKNVTIAKLPVPSQNE